MLGRSSSSVLGEIRRSRPREQIYRDTIFPFRGSDTGSLRLGLSQIDALDADPADWPQGSWRNQLKINWLPRMDSNHDKVIQNHLCYRYTTRQYFCSSSNSQVEIPDWSPNFRSFGSPASCAGRVRISTEGLKSTQFFPVCENAADRASMAVERRICAFFSWRPADGKGGP